MLGGQTSKVTLQKKRMSVIGDQPLRTTLKTQKMNKETFHGSYLNFYILGRAPSTNATFILMGI